MQTFEVKYDQLKDLPKIREYNCKLYSMQGYISRVKRPKCYNGGGHTDKAGHRNSCSKGRIQYLKKSEKREEEGEIRRTGKNV